MIHSTPRVFLFRLFLAAVFLSAVPLAATDTPDVPGTSAPLDLSLYTSFNVYDSRSEPAELWHRLGLTALYETTPFRLSMDISVLNDDRYVGGEDGNMRGYRFDMREGTVEVGNGVVRLRGGREQQRDEFESPYTLFFNSFENAFSPVILELSYEGDFFFYRSRWMELTRNSSEFRRRRPVYDSGDAETSQELYPWEDVAEQDGEDGDTTNGIVGYVVEPFERGGNYTVYGIKPGDWRIGFQESVIYINQSFHPEYFLSPLPPYFTQLFIDSRNAPWRQRDDENLHMGIFAEYTQPDWAAYGQFLMGDINLGFLAPNPEDWQQPQKWAWSFGGWLDTDIGRFGAYHAGATRYLFQATTTSANTSQTVDIFSTQRYEYTYWPAVEFRPSQPIEQRRAIDYRENYIGYKYGENNLALMLTWEHEHEGWDVDAMLEGVVSGSKSPSNPWHGYRLHPGRRGNSNAPHFIHLLNESPLEWTLRLASSITRQIGPWELTGSLMTGYVWNELELRYPDNTPNASAEPRIWMPGSVSRPLFQLSLGGRYSYSWRP